MQIKLLTDIIFDLFGKPSVSVVEILYGKKKVNEFDLAKKLTLTINQTRNLLYKLSEVGLVSFTRKKDKKKGWYTYFWTLEEDSSLEFLKRVITDKIDNLSRQIDSRMKERFYECKICSTEHKEEEALLNNFSCPECDTIYDLADNKKLVASLEKQRERYVHILKTVTDEMSVVNEKNTKKRARENKKEEKEKAKVRAAKRELNKKLKAKNSPVKLKEKSKVKLKGKKVKAKIKKGKKPSSSKRKKKI